jgi:23S rRNA (pseudouridine1915-N3)-methyltransferase
MNITLLVMGKNEMPFVQEGLNIYLERLKHYVNFSFDVIPALKEQRNLKPDDVKQREGQLILKHLEKSDCVVLLDEHGKQYTSVAFSQYLQQKMNGGVRQLTFVIGGAYGFSDEVYRAAQDKLSLSNMTFNHQMVRLFFTEQLYRAFTILHHEKYHNE